MTDEQFCRDCGHRPDCGKVYEQLGAASGPCVTLKVIIAFLLPIGVFIASLALFEKVLSVAAVSETARTTAGFALAAAVTVAVILNIKILNDHLAKKQSPNNDDNG